MEETPTRPPDPSAGGRVRSAAAEVQAAGPGTRVAGSFRDPSGFVFVRDGVLYRQVNQRHREPYQQLMASGLYESLVADGMLVEHEEVDVPFADEEVAYKVIRPTRVPFVSYPYEWCFGQLKDAALATLQIQKAALARGMSLRDSSAYNIQFHEGRPLLIDTLSFEAYAEGKPWVAYRQFCQHFLAPLALMAYRDVRLGILLRDYIDGVPLDLAAALLPGRTRLRFSLLSHIHMHAKSQKRHQRRSERTSTLVLSKRALGNLIDHLIGSVESLNWEPGWTPWGEYYEDTNYSAAAMAAKTRIVGECIDALKMATVWDLGANDGRFSRLAARAATTVVSADADPAAVEKNYRQCRSDGDRRIHPLLLDLTNPSPALGWAHRERQSLRERGPADAVVALALVHHLAISNNVPLAAIAAFFAELAPALIIEFVPKSDSQVKRLLTTREDVFAQYTQDGFEAAFAPCFRVERKEAVVDSDRVIYQMRHHAAP